MTDQEAKSKARKQNYIINRNGCWEWMGTIYDHGYGIVSIDGQRKRAHRYIYEQHKGPIPEGMQLDHLCRNRCCVNPDHLEPVTGKENVRRGDRCSIDLETAERIHADLEAGFAKYNIAASYDCTIHIVNNIAAGRTWKKEAA